VIKLPEVADNIFWPRETGMSSSSGSPSTWGSILSWRWPGMCPHVGEEEEAIAIALRYGQDGGTSPGKRLRQCNLYRATSSIML